MYSERIWNQKCTQSKGWLGGGLSEISQDASFFSQEKIILLKNRMNTIHNDGKVIPGKNHGLGRRLGNFTRPEF